MVDLAEQWEDLVPLVESDVFQQGHLRRRHPLLRQLPRVLPRSSHVQADSGQLTDLMLFDCPFCHGALVLVG
jgi:hypothetical protein